MSLKDKKKRSAEELMADFIINALENKDQDPQKSERVKKMSKDLNFRPPRPADPSQ